MKFGVANKPSGRHNSDTLGVVTRGQGQIADLQRGALNRLARWSASQTIICPPQPLIQGQSLGTTSTLPRYPRLWFE